MALNIGGKKVETPPAKPLKVSSELAALIAASAKHYGDDKLFLKGNDIPDVLRLPTGVYEVDVGLNGGFPRGRYSIIVGPEGVGKSIMMYLALAQAQRYPPPCNKAVLIDLEDTYDPKWGAVLGIDNDLLTVIKPSYGEQAMDMIEAVAQADDVLCLGIDSISLALSTAEIDQSSEKFNVGNEAKMVTRMVNKLILAMSKEKKRDHTPCVIFINQIRYKIGVMFGNPETQNGGKAFLFNSSLTLRIGGNEKIDKATNLALLKATKIEVKKAKVPINHKVIEYDMCVVAHDKLKPGQTDSWGLLSASLKASGHLENLGPGKGWKLLKKTYPTLVPIKEQYEENDAFRNQLQQLVASTFHGKGIAVSAEGVAAPSSSYTVLPDGTKVDPDTGEVL